MRSGRVWGMGLTLFAVLAAAVLVDSGLAAGWKAAKGPLMTRWAKDVSPGKVHPEYPRPQMVRDGWQNLNGLWDYAIVDRAAERPGTFQGQILVPFPVESALSGVMKPVGEAKRLWYRRTFAAPADWRQGRVLLHFGAVDWESTVWVNGHELGTHRGGYDPFTYDITKALKAEGEQEIVVAVWDPTDAGTQPRGKQVRDPRGIWYTANTGIWQTVWLEPVPQASIARLAMVTQQNGRALNLQVATSGAKPGDVIEAVALDGSREAARAQAAVGKKLQLEFSQPKLWSPDAPHLYDLKIELRRGGQTLDAVGSYCGLRTVSLAKDDGGILRMMLNGKFVFQIGPLDQGWWPDGLYTAPTDAALRYDLEVLKKAGYNMLRKHVKVEPARLYYWCDKMGLIVWQDMPNGDAHIRDDDPDLTRSAESVEQFELELQRLIRGLYNHPSIVMWVPFNEGWGQFDTARIAELVKKLDPSRLVNSASGWTDRGAGDVNDMHRYPGPDMPPVEARRAVVLGEFGGLGLPLSGHTWQEEKNWGYRSFKTPQELTDAYLALIRNLHPLVGRGLSAAVYTQTTDVEIEVNGLMTYDRAVIKMPLEKLAAAHAKLAGPPPVVKTVVPTSRQEGQRWRYTFEKPAAGWQQAGFDDSAWQQGVGGFGKQGTPGAVVRTPWQTSDIWLRRTFQAKEPFEDPQLVIHHDEDAQVYINGQLAVETTGHVGSYLVVPLAAESRRAVRTGRNVLAVHCRQSTGGQYIDVGLEDVVTP